jgi:hypothetical protein
VVWICTRSADNGAILFFPSGRKYPVDERRTIISSSLIRKHLDEIPRDEVHAVIKHMAMNVDELLSILDYIGCKIYTNYRLYDKLYRHGLIDLDVWVELLETPSLTLLTAKTAILDKARTAVYCGNVETQQETQDDLALHLGW